ncbi:hypothetical protein BDW22DRAFT_1355780 [Trametopsis cervina]|nr:hypothetical protein BDW22DRAFT_1355780 [Trametopsis cervina]
MAPLRERAPSNSAKDWKPHTTTPLRIAKRDSPQPEELIVPALTPSRRRSVRNLQDGARVTNSPFVLSQMAVRPTTFYASPTRRVSGEKRPRTHSMNDQAENENPAVRKRRQSQVSELLVQKKPVTNSLFKSSKPSADKSRRVSQDIRQPGPALAQEPEHSSQTDQTESDSELAPPPPAKEWFGRASPHRGQSPSRPSLVSRRLHGPRMTRRHSRRKTVTFDEKCDVLEFDVEEENSNPFDWVTDDDDNFDANDGMDVDRLSHDHHDHHDHDDLRAPLRVHNPEADESFDSFQVGEDSITGLVDSLLNDTRPSTPPHDERALPADLETEDGVPYGRTHHADRVVAAHEHHTEEPEIHPVEVALPSQAVASTPTHSREGTPITSVSPGSRIPLGRSTHAERFKAQKEQERLEMDDDLRQMPPSPSPAKPKSTLPSSRANTESLIPRFSLALSRGVSTPPTFNNVDPFSYPQIKDMDHPIDVSLDSINRSQDDPANLSIGNSEVSLSGLNFELDHDELAPRSSVESNQGIPTTSTPPTSPPSHPFMFTSFHPNFSKDSLNGRISTPTKGSPLIINGSAGSSSQYSPLGGSPFARSPQSRSGSPLVRPGLAKSGSSSSLIGDANGSPSGRSPRITREAVQKKLEKQRSFDSPLREAARESLPASDADSPLRRSIDSPSGVHTRLNTPTSARHVPKRIPAPKLTREVTHDGVMSLDPEPQLIDPPRAYLTTRSISVDDLAGAQHNADPSPSNGPMSNLSDMKSALDRLMADVAGEATLAPDGKGVIGLKVEAVTEGIQAGRFTVPTPIDGAEEQSDADVSMDVDESHRRSGEMEDVIEETETYQPAERPESLLQANFLSPDTTGNPPNRSTSPVPSTKEAIRAREELIKAMKQRRRAEEEDEDEQEMDADTSVEYFKPPIRMSIKRPNRRRSRSTGDAGDQFTRHGLRKRADTLQTDSRGLLDSLDIEDDQLADSIDRELRKLEGPNRTKYHVRERSETIYATADLDKVSHVNSAGDVDSGKAWRTVRRPSDMNEYARQIKELRAKDSSGKAHGKIFVKVLGLRNLDVPIPQQPSAVTCTLNNGVHFVTTPPVRLGRECRIGQEFELIESSKLEFTLTMKVQLDQHIKDQIKANTPPPRAAPLKVNSPPASKGGMSRLFGGPKKTAKARSRTPVQTPPPQHILSENLARYLDADGVLARTYISFKDIARRCDARVFETSFPLIGQKSQKDSRPQTLQVGEMILQVFRLPPLPGIPPEQLPQSLEECHRGIQNVSWHKVTYYEGTLTQNGGDCMSWRRRHLRVIGATLVAFNDVTKKATATIDLKKAVAVADDREPTILSPDSGMSGRSSRYVEHDGPYGMERSFRLIFSNKQEITFYADTDEEKARWLEVLRAIVGYIPSNPLWAELLWQRQQELEKRQSGSLPKPQSPAAVQASTTSPPPEPSRVTSPLPAPQARRPMSRQGR